MDAMEYLAGRTLKMHEVYASEISLSFCASSCAPNRNLMASLNSISTIASEVGFPYEIILVAPPGDRDIRETLNSVSESIENFYVVKQHVRNQGDGVKVAYESSKGKYFVPFDAGVVYDIRYSDLIHSFIMKREKKLFLSELPVIHRDLVTEAGGYRSLSHGHDIDLYSRIALMYGLVAYPALFNRVPLVSPPPVYRNGHDMTAVAGSSFRCMRDHIIACNYDLEDLFTLYLRGAKKEHLAGMMYFSLLYAASRMAGIKPYRFDRNNYLILMENIFESLVLKEFSRYGLQDIKANMMLSKEELYYLKNRSRVYREVVFSINEYVAEV